MSGLVKQPVPDIRACQTTGTGYPGLPNNPAPDIRACQTTDTGYPGLPNKRHRISGLAKQPAPDIIQHKNSSGLTLINNISPWYDSQ